MPAHDPSGNGPAHDSTPPRGSKAKMTYLNIDKTGMSMSGKTAVTIFSTLAGLIIFLVSGWFAFLSINATKADIDQHDENVVAHKIIIEKDEEAVPIKVVVKEHHRVIKEIPKIKREVVIVKNGFYEERAERLADRAADRVKGERQSRERWKYVRAKAMKNLEQKKPIRDGLEDYL